MFVCSANNSALKHKRKTLGANDVFSALDDMEFQEFIPELKECLEGKTSCDHTFSCIVMVTALSVALSW